MAERSEQDWTDDAAYTERLVTAETRSWKRVLGVRAPYRWNLKRLGLGRTLDLGCGIGRNLVDLPAGSVGVDHNAASVAVARSRGCIAYTPEEFFATDRGAFDSLLVAHVLEHMAATDNAPLLRRYLAFVSPGGRVVLITPQEAGFRSDPTHVDFVGFDELGRLVDQLSLIPVAVSSFPLPRWAGRWFRHNEHLVVARTPEVGS